MGVSRELKEWFEQVYEVVSALERVSLTTSVKEGKMEMFTRYIRHIIALFKERPKPLASRSALNRWLYQVCGQVIDIERFADRCFQLDDRQRGFDWFVGWMVREFNHSGVLFFRD